MVEVDKEGLKLLLEKQGKSFAINKLIQNAWDTNASEVKITLTRAEKNKGKGTVLLKVEDNDPDGFRDLKEAYTLFASSSKKAKPEKRGRFNLGEKLVLAICRTAQITSTGGRISFESNERKFSKTHLREWGTLFEAQIHATPQELEEMLQSVKTLIPPCVQGEEGKLGEKRPKKPPKKLPKKPPKKPTSTERESHTATR